MKAIQVNLGQGMFAITTFSDNDGNGLLFKNTGEKHVIGSESNAPPNIEHWPEEDELYIKCTNRESALVLMEQVCRLVAMFTDK